MALGNQREAKPGTEEGRGARAPNSGGWRHGRQPQSCPWGGRHAGRAQHEPRSLLSGSLPSPGTHAAPAGSHLGLLPKEATASGLRTWGHVPLRPRGKAAVVKRRPFPLLRLKITSEKMKCKSVILIFSLPLCNSR